jgi:hypothetical protein
MTTNYYAQRVTVPAAFVTKGRQRVKQFHESVYLKNGDEFEIELFNPTTEKVLAKIELNGKSLGSGIILRPAERVFLERYLDEAKKFLFETYQVEANNPDVEQAIHLNGLVKVEFFEEQKQKYNPYTITYSNGSDWGWNPGVTQPGIYYRGGTAKGITPTFTSDCNIPNVPAAKNFDPNIQNLSGEVNFYCCNMDAQMELKATPISQKLSRDVKETGRIEKGSNSNQSFVYDNTVFNSWSTWITTWHILPESEKPLESHDLKCFCPNCGAKQKRHTHKFCPICGTQYE